MHFGTLPELAITSKCAKSVWEGRRGGVGVRGGEGVLDQSEQVDVSRCEENKAAEREGLGFITARSTHHPGRHTGEQPPLSGRASHSLLPLNC